MKIYICPHPAMQGGHKQTYSQRLVGSEWRAHEEESASAECSGWSWADELTTQRQWQCGLQMTPTPERRQSLTPVSTNWPPKHTHMVFSDVHVRYMLLPVHLSSVVCIVRVPYSSRSNFRQYFYGIRYFGHPLTSSENFTDIVPGEPLRRGS